MRRILSIVLVIALVLGAAAYLFRGALALTLTRFAAERAIGGDAIAKLPDGLHVVLCGAGSPLADPVRSGPCVAIIAGTHLFEVDAGDGAGRNLTRLDLPPGRVEALD